MSITKCYTKCAFVVKYFTYKKINISPKIPAEKKTRNIYIPSEKKKEFITFGTDKASHSIKILSRLQNVCLLNLHAAQFVSNQFCSSEL